MAVRKLFGYLDKRLGALALLALLTLAAPAHAQTAATGHLDWGLKESFRRYIAGPIAHGTIAVADGATVNADGTFRFPLAGGAYAPERRTGQFRARGTVKFSGHNGLLDMTLSDPRVVLDGEVAELHADVASKSLNTGTVEQFPNVRFATLSGAAAPADLTAPAVFGPMPATLTEPGAPAFAGFYAAGTALDPVTLTVAAWVPEGGTPPVEEEPEPQPEVTLTPTPVAAAPTVTPAPTPVAPAEAVRRPAIKRVAARQTIRRSGVVRVAALTCGSAACTITRPKRVKIRIGGRTYRAKLSGPTRLAAGRTAELRLRLPKAAVRALGRRTVKARVTVTVTAGGELVKRTLSTSFRLRKR